MGEDKGRGTFSIKGTECLDYVFREEGATLRILPERKVQGFCLELRDLGGEMGANGS